MLEVQFSNTHRTAPIAMQAILVWFTDNAAAEDNDLRGDHPQLCYVIKDMYHSMAIVRKAVDPTHPLAGNVLTACYGTLQANGCPT